MGFYYPADTVAATQLAGMTVGTSEPVAPEDGHLWLDPVTGMASVRWLGQWRAASSSTPVEAKYGVAVVTLPGVETAAAGRLPPHAKVSTVLAGLVQAATGQVAEKEPTVTWLPAVVQAATGVVMPTVRAAMGVGLPAIGQQAGGRVTQPATGQAASGLPGVETAAQTVGQVRAAAIQSLPAVITAAPTYVGTRAFADIDSALPPVGQTGQARAAVRAAAASGLPALGQQAAGKLPVVAQAATSLPGLVQQVGSSIGLGDISLGQLDDVFVVAVRDSASLGFSVLDDRWTPEGLPIVPAEGSITSGLPGLGQQAAGTAAATGQVGSQLGPVEQAAVGFQGEVQLARIEIGLPDVAVAAQVTATVRGTSGSTIGPFEVSIVGLVSLTIDTLADMDDVDVTGAADGDVLTFDDDAGLWKPEPEGD